MKNSDAIHRLDTYPQHERGKRRFVLAKNIFCHPLPSNNEIASCIRMLAEYRAGTRKPKVKGKIDPRVLVPTQHGIFRRKLRQDFAKTKQDGPIIITRVFTHISLLDGHHKSASAILTGQPEIDYIEI